MAIWPSTTLTGASASRRWPPPRAPTSWSPARASRWAICEVKEWRSSAIDRRLAVQRFGSFSSEEVHQTAADAVQAAAGEQLRPFAGVGMPLVVVLANPHHCVVPLDRDDMARSLFDITDQMQVGTGGLVRRVSFGCLCRHRRGRHPPQPPPLPLRRGWSCTSARTSGTSWTSRPPPCARRRLRAQGTSGAHRRRRCSKP